MPLQITFCIIFQPFKLKYKNLKITENVFLKDIFDIKFSIFFKMSVEKTFLKSISLIDIFPNGKNKTKFRDISYPILFQEFFILFYRKGLKSPI